MTILSKNVLAAVGIPSIAHVMLPHVLDEVDLLARLGPGGAWRVSCTVTTKEEEKKKNG